MPSAGHRDGAPATAAGVAAAARQNGFGVDKGELQSVTQILKDTLHKFGPEVLGLSFALLQGQHEGRHVSEAELQAALKEPAART